VKTALAIMFSPQEAVARDLLVRLIDETERARERGAAADVDSFDELLTARADMLESLERSVHALALAAHQVRNAGASPARETLIDLAAQLEKANTSLMQSVRAERDLVAAAIQASDRPDAMASRYAGSAPTEAPRLNLIR
jgi:hypothetical protein